MILRYSFLQVNEAYSVLSDPQKKARYDRGEDLDGNGFSTAGKIFFVFPISLDLNSKSSGRTMQLSWLIYTAQPRSWRFDVLC